jgi:membrane protease YdiL (CAAX protease family)
MTQFHFTWAGLGLAAPTTWLHTLMYAVFWTGVLVAYSPTADWAAAKVFKAPPRLGLFLGVRDSTLKLIIAIALAWVLGAFLEEIVLRGVVVGALRFAVGTWPAVAAAAAIAFVIHLYQGPRGALITAQLSLLFGVLFAASGYDLWAVILAHGFYDTIALVQLARKPKAQSL